MNSERRGAYANDIKWNTSSSLQLFSKNALSPPSPPTAYQCCINTTNICNKHCNLVAPDLNDVYRQFELLPLTGSSQSPFNTLPWPSAASLRQAVEHVQIKFSFDIMMPSIASTEHLPSPVHCQEVVTLCQTRSGR